MRPPEGFEVSREMVSTETRILCVAHLPAAASDWHDAIGRHQRPGERQNGAEQPHEAALFRLQHPDEARQFPVRNITPGRSLPWAEKCSPIRLDDLQRLRQLES